MATTATRNPVNGSYVVDAIIGGYLVTRVYYGYSKREAVAAFNAEMRPRRKAQVTANRTAFRADVARRELQGIVAAMN